MLNAVTPPRSTRGALIPKSEGYTLMKVILIADVYKHGVAGEVVEVADGFARNWLLPKKLAVKASAGELKRLESMRLEAEARKAALEGRLNDLARQIDGVELFFGRRASPTGKLFGSVTTTEIADALNKKTGIDINRRRISGTLPREVGSHRVPVRLGTEISPEIIITIVREEEFNEYMKRRAAQDAAASEAAELAHLEAATTPTDADYGVVSAPDAEAAAESAPASE